MAPCITPSQGALVWSALAASPRALLIAVSVLAGGIMVFLFRYTSNQDAIRRCKDQLRAHLLAVRLFQDQPRVVLSSYHRILTGTGRYLRLAGKPMLATILPLLILVVHLDRYLGSTPIRPQQPFLLSVRLDDPTHLNDVSLRLPDGFATSAPAVHDPDSNEVSWRLTAANSGTYMVNVVVAGQDIAKKVVVSNSVARLSCCRFRDHLWRRLFTSAEPPLARTAAVERIEVQYPERTLQFVGYELNWLWPFFIISLAAGFLLKTILHIEI